MKRLILLSFFVLCLSSCAKDSDESSEEVHVHYTWNNTEGNLTTTLGEVSPGGKIESEGNRLVSGQAFYELSGHCNTIEDAGGEYSIIPQD